ncbi:MAG TPA: hypothetical protein VMY88_13165 [Acidimicrobiales bacterium]|nr:hypothetical protein [Acidimicrobiales bacterium]
MRAEGLRRHPVLAGGTALGVVVLAAVGFVRGARLTIPYLLLVLAGAVLLVFSEPKVRYSRLALGGLAAWGLMHLAGGLIELDDGRLLYNVVVARWIHVDNVVHLIGFGSAGIATWEALSASLDPAKLSARASFFVACLAGMGLGAANEVVEFASTHILDATGVGGFQNTGRDLVANLVGSVAAGVVCARRSARFEPAR